MTKWIVTEGKNQRVPVFPSERWEFCSSFWKRTSEKCSENISYFPSTLELEGGFEQKMVLMSVTRLVKCYECLCLCVCALSCVWLFGTLWTLALQAPLSMGFPRQEYWNRLSFPLPGDLPNPGMKLMSFVSHAWTGGFFITVSPGR